MLLIRPGVRPGPSLGEDLRPAMHMCVPRSAFVALSSLTVSSSLSLLLLLSRTRGAACIDNVWLRGGGFES